MSDNEKCPNCQWDMWLGKCLMCGYENHEPLRTTPQREWQGLTDEEKQRFNKHIGLYFLKQIEDILKEKNG